MFAVDQAAFAVFYDQADISTALAPQLLELVYTDFLEGQSDELTLRVEDGDGRWLRGWYPGQGDTLRAALGWRGAALTDLGSFEIDEIEYGFAPNQMTVKALSTGLTRANRTLQPKAYEDTTLAQIAAVVAARLGLELVGEIREVPIARATQYQERDVEFLTRLAAEYHHSFKIVGRQLVFADKAALGQGAPVAALNPADCLSLHLRDRLKDRAKRVEVRDFDRHGKRVVEEAKDNAPLRGGAALSEDTLKLSGRGESEAATAARAEAALAAENEDLTAGEAVVIGNPKLVAGAVVRLAGVGRLSGRYLIKSSRHSLTRGDGYITTLELRALAAEDGHADA